MEEINNLQVGKSFSTQGKIEKPPSYQEIIMVIIKFIMIIMGIRIIIRIIMCIIMVIMGIIMCRMIIMFIIMVIIII